MKVTENVAAKLLWFAASGKPDAAEQMAGYMMRRGAPLDTVRAELAAIMAPDFFLPMMEALPWLAADTFGESGQPSAAGDSIREKVLRLIDDADVTGAARSELRPRFADRRGFDEAIQALKDDGEVVAVEMATRGRPAVVYFAAGRAPKATRAESLADRLCLAIADKRHAGAAVDALKAEFYGESGLRAALAELERGKRIDRHDIGGVPTCWTREFSPVVKMGGKVTIAHDPFAFTGDTARRLAAEIEAAESAMTPEELAAARAARKAGG